VDILEDLELMVEMIEIEDAEGLDEAYLVGDKDFERIAPEIMDRIAQERRRLENEYISKYGPLLKKDYSSKEFIDPNDHIRLLRLMIRVPITKKEYKAAYLYKILKHAYVSDDISIVYLLFEDSYVRITRDDVAEAKLKTEVTRESIMRIPLAIKEKYDEEWLFRELADIGRKLEEAGVRSRLDGSEDDLVDGDGFFKKLAEEVGEVGEPTGEPKGNRDVEGMNVETSTSFPKYLHRDGETGRRALLEENPSGSAAHREDYDNRPMDHAMLREIIAKDEEDLMELAPVSVMAENRGRGKEEWGWTGEIPKAIPRERFDIMKDRLREGGYHLVGTDPRGYLILRRNDGTGTLVGFARECDVPEMAGLEKAVEMQGVDSGIMISDRFTYDCKLYVIGRDLDIVSWEQFKEGGLAMEPSWP